MRADLADRPGQDRCGLLTRAIACGKGALTVLAPEAMPHEHADTADNLENVRLAYEAAACTSPVDEFEPAG